MNESTLTHLKILVERAVRPVRASRTHKRKMREELLAHVTAVFEEEAARLGNEAAALDRTGQRFGNPKELTIPLQESVPAGDRIARFLEGRPGESALRAAVRLAGLSTALALIIFVALLFAGAALNVWPTEALLLCVSSLLALPLYLFSLAFLADWMRQALYGPAGRSWLKVALVAVGWWLLTLLVLAGLPLLHGIRPSDSDHVVAVVMATSWVGNPLLPFCLAHSSAVRIRDHREWASLRIE